MGCGDIFTPELLDDDGLCMDCDYLAYTKAVKAEADAEDAEAVREAWVVVDKIVADADAELMANAKAEIARDLAERNPWEALKARERVVKDRELSRRENRQNAYDTADASTGELANVEPDWEAYDSMTMDVVRSTIGKLPAILSRTDGRTILYAGKVNTVGSRDPGRR